MDKRYNCTYCDIGEVETGTNVFYIHAVQEGC